MSNNEYKLEETEYFKEWLNQFLEVKKVYTVFTRNGKAFVGTFKGLDSDTLHFVDSNKHHIYVNIKNIDLIIRGGEDL
jgi:hypothetical protein